MQLFKAEYRNLDCHILCIRVQTDAVALVAQLFAEHHAGSNLYHRHAGNLADVWDGTGGTWVDLDNIDLIVVDDILDIDQTDNFERTS